MIKKWPYILIVLFMTLFPAFFMGNVVFDNTIRSYAPLKSDHFVSYDNYRDIFGSDEVLALIIEIDNFESLELLEKIAKIMPAIRQIDGINRIYSLFDQDYIEASFDGLKVSPILDENALESETLSFWKARAENSFAAKKLLLSKDGKFMSIALEPTKDLTTMQRRQVRDQVLAIFKDAGLSKNVHGLAGPWAIDVKSFETSFFDLLTFIPFTLGIAFLLLWLSFPKLGPLVLVMVLINAISSTAIGLFGVFGIPFTIISSMVPTLLMALSIASFIHYFNMDRVASKLGLIKKEKVKYILDHIKRPTLFTGLTTICALLSLTLNEIPPIRTFGLITAFGTLVVVFTTLKVLPELMEVISPVEWKEESRIFTFIGEIVRKVSTHAMLYPKTTVLSWLALILILAPTILNIKVESNLLKFFNEDDPITKETNFFQENFSGTAVLEIIFNDAQILSSNNLKKIRLLQNRLESYSEIDRALSAVDFIERMNGAFQNDEAKNVIPENDDLIAQYLFIYDGKDLGRFLNENQDKMRIVLNVNRHNVTEIEGLIKVIEKDISELLPGVDYDFSGQGYIFVKQNDLLVHGQTKTLWVSVVIILLILIYLWKSFVDGLFTLIPNVMPLVTLFIIMGLFDIWLDMGTAMIASVAVGIAVDDTIHIFSTYKNRMSHTGNVDQAIAETMELTGKAVSATTIILCAQFFVLTLSGFIPTRNFGMLTGMGLFVALLADIHLLPAMIKWRYGSKK